MSSRRSDRIASVGDNCIDVSLPALDGADEDALAGLVPASGLAPAELPGGNAFNVARVLARSGLSAAYLGAVGDDAAAELILGAGTSAGVDMSRVMRVTGPTGRTVVGRDAHGERHFISEDYGAAARYRLDDETIEWLMRAQWLHFARQPDVAQHTERLRAGGATVSSDVGYAGGLIQLGEATGGMDVVFMSASAEPGLSTDDLLEQALRARAALAVVTLGAAGSVADDGTSRWRVDAVAVSPVVDTLGAGDAYIGAFIAARVGGAGVEQAMQAGARAGAAACTQWGLAGVLQTETVPPAGHAPSPRPAVNEEERV